MSKVKELLDQDKHESFMPAPNFLAQSEKAALPTNAEIRAGSTILGNAMLTGASKNDQTKADYSLVPPELLEAVARAFMVGENKYGRYNYYKGHKASQLVAAAMRHLTAWMNGEENDPVDGQPHLGSVGACVAMLLKQQKLGTLKDNRYKEGT